MKVEADAVSIAQHRGHNFACALATDREYG
jgi:hypothetical protein